MDRKRISDFIISNFYVQPDSFDDTTSLVGQGIVDSAGMIEVVLFLEREFGIKVAESEMLPENLDSVDQLCAYIAAKKQSLRSA